MDDLVRIPGTSWRVGLDPVLGLLPGVGDWISWAISLQILWAAVRMEAGAPLVARMLGNVVVDALVGTVPLAGDLFDAGWKANRRNLRLLEAHARDPDRTATSSRILAAGILAGGVVALAGAAWGAWWVLQQVAGLLR